MARKLLDLGTSKIPCMNHDGSNPLSEMDLLKDLSGFNSDQISKRYDSFSRVAKHGEMDSHAFREFLSHFVEGPLAAMGAPTLFALVDTDKNGGISFKEALSGLSMGDPNATMVSKMKKLLSLWKNVKGSEIDAEQVTGMMQNLLSVSSDKGTGFTTEAIKGLVNSTKSGSTVNIGELSKGLDSLTQLGF
ncbi:unnamed protein product [Notodromas monacha]|uniref:EF-hand domain-containing protein n=1 Tax=Notodromas monacha TaxID=399045 RepID=A0A7R9BS61_9CRUS|nr:unnamed protein product [Notodromas monacha]CAG0920701.1 unnamed protein product [Notodromas monacha]